MDPNYGQGGNAAYGTPVGQTTQQKPQAYAVPVQGITAAQQGASGSQAWEGEGCWMLTYLVFTIVFTVAFLFMSWVFVFPMILAIIAGSFHSCSCCAACYGDDERRGSRIIQILAIVATILDVALAVVVIVLASLIDTSYESYPHTTGVSYDTVRTQLIVAGVMGAVHAIMSIVTAAKFTQMIKSFDRVSSGRVSI